MSLTFKSLRIISTYVASLALTGCMMFMKSPADMEYGRTRISSGGHYRLTIRPEGDSIPKGKLQTWGLHVETTAGTPVDSATITVNGGMPKHGHGLPTKPLVRKHLGNGDHLVEGLKFNMGGWWVVRFRLDAAAGADSVVFNLTL